MTSFSELLSIFALAFVLGALLPFAVRPILHRYNMVDVPNERSSHTAPTYRGMGLATAAATFVAFVAATLFGWTYRSAESLQLAVTIAAAILCALALGWLEDIRGVSIVRRAGLQLVIGVLVSVSFATVQGTNILLLTLGAIFVAGYINVANFMDGINGISGAHGLVAGLAYALTGWMVNLPWLALAGVAVAGAFAAFLPWNVRPGKNVFLGDAGSYVLGAALGTLAVGAWFADVPVGFCSADDVSGGRGYDSVPSFYGGGAVVQAAPYSHLSASDGCWFQPPWFDRRGDRYDHSGVGAAGVCL